MAHVRVQNIDISNFSIAVCFFYFSISKQIKHTEKYKNVSIVVETRRGKVNRKKNKTMGIVFKFFQLSLRMFIEVKDFKKNVKLRVHK